MDTPYDGGSAFPVLERGAGGLELTSPGLSKRELFAAILMHAELVTCGVPGEAADALIEAAATAGQEPVDRMASNAAESADALLRALTKVPEAPIPAHLLYDGWTTPSSQHAAIKRIARQPDFDELPEFLRNFVSMALDRIKEAEEGIPF